MTRTSLILNTHKCLVSWQSTHNSYVDETEKKIKQMTKVLLFFLKEGDKKAANDKKNIS